ncbi:MAG: hypothetical protein Q9227_003397 [Pyrenula ochraceoflavens]
MSDTEKQTDGLANGHADAVPTYGSQIVTIVVGSGLRLDEVFHIHLGALLGQTTFLSAFGPPCDKPFPLNPPGGDDAKAKDQPSIKPEEIDRAGSEDTLLPDNVQNVMNTRTVYAHYWLKKVQSGAFQVVVDYLYNIRPQIPRSLEGSKTLLRAYILAIEWDIEDLQNSIVGRFRAFHQAVDFNIDLFAYLTNRMPETKKNLHTENKLIQYFIEQMSFDIASKGIDDFEKHNKYFEYFINEDTRPLRLVFVKALARHAHYVRRLEDPAVLPGCRFHVHTNQNGNDIICMGDED